jgi:DNA-binding CsgD family transcriptional regulator
VPFRITDSTVLALVAQVYDAVIDPCRWPEFLSAFGRALAGRGTMIYTHNTETFEAITGADPKSLNACVDWNPEFLGSLSQYYNQVNVWAHNEAVLKPGRLVTGSMLYPVRELPKTEFYSDWLQPQDIFHAIGGIIVQDGPWATKFSSVRSGNAGDYSAEERRLYQELLPHLARAAHLQRRFTFLQSLSASSLAILDTVSAPIILLDRTGRVVHLNASADAELRRADPLRLKLSGELNVQGSQRMQTALRTVIAAATDPVRGSREGLTNVAKLTRRNGETLSVQGLPLPKPNDPLSVTGTGQRLAACALVVHGGASGVPLVGAQILRHIYGLTPAEVQVVLAIGDGETIKRYAERRGISRNTAVSQLKRAFDKTGLRRQSELVRWLFQRGTIQPRDRSTN